MISLEPTNPAPSAIAVQYSTKPIGSAVPSVAGWSQAAAIPINPDAAMGSER